MLLDGKAALVTGASRGIGKAIALRLAAEGAKVAINYAGNATAANEVKAEIEAHGGEAVVLQADVSNPEAAEHLVAQTIEALGALDIVVNNAGITRDGLLLRMREEDFARVLDTNLKGVFHVTKVAAKHMAKRRSGRIINMASVVGLRGNIGQANYAAAKAGVIGFTKAVARELAPRNVTVNALAPGFIATDMTAVIPEKIKEKLVEGIPLGRMGRVEDVAEAALFLASEGASYVTGQVLRVDGGMAM